MFEAAAGGLEGMAAFEPTPTGTEDVAPWATWHTADELSRRIDGAVRADGYRAESVGACGTACEVQAPAEEPGTFPPAGLMVAMVQMPAGAGAAGGRFEPLGGVKLLVPMALPVGFGATAEGLEEVMPLTLTAGGEPLSVGLRCWRWRHGRNPGRHRCVRLAS